jgi:glycine/D-amino acid oxidase-like deaminating enzyme
MNQDRRSFLKNTAALAAGAGLFGAGAASGYALERGHASRPKLDVVLPKVTRERMLRTTVGLRPHRPIGFRLEAEKIDGRTIVHNYGHGGSGWSLSWGTGHLAADLVDATGEQDVAVLGCGVVGLAAARLLQRRGKQVTIYAKDLPPRVTSNYASAGWSPTATLCDPAKISEEFKVVFEKAARLSHRYFQDLIGQPYGVHYRQSIRFRETAAEATAAGAGPARGGPADPNFYGNVIRDLSPKTIELAPEQHGLPFEVASLSTSMRFEVHVYLDGMLRDFAFHGGKIVVREFAKLDDILFLPQKVTVNCLGLGAKQVLNDEHLMPIRGQLTILAPQEDLKYGIGFEGFSAAPRYDGVTVGNTMIMGEWSTVPDIKESYRVVDGFRELLGKITHTA